MKLRTQNKLQVSIFGRKTLLSFILKAFALAHRSVNSSSILLPKFEPSGWEGTQAVEIRVSMLLPLEGGKGG